ncbi:MAG: HU family DNA-binding protein [Fusobacteriaceae bacterium]|nr:HU family DNA-binding protein [Fusobacteriaceae bacterium]
MTKKEFVEKFAAKLEGVSKKDAEKYVASFLETVEESLVSGVTVSFVGWGKWEVIDREAREVRNPQTGAKIKVPAKKVVKFRVGKGLEDKVGAVKPTKKVKK